MKARLVAFGASVVSLGTMGCASLSGLSGGTEGPVDATPDARRDGAILDAPLLHDVDDVEHGSGQPYPLAVLADSPLAYWRFNETSGVSAFDETAHNHTLSIMGNITLGVSGALADPPNRAFAFDGVTSNLSVDAFPEFVDQATFSLEAWFALAAPPDSTYRHIFMRGAFPMSGRQGYGIQVVSPDYISFERYVDGVQVFAGNSFSTATPFLYVVGTYDGSRLRLYLNAVLVNSIADSRAAVATGAPFGVGVFNNNGSIGDVWDGVLDEAAVYDTVLSPARIQAHFAAASKL